MSEISIVCPCRGRDILVKDFLHHFTKMCPEAEIILVYQDDDGKFMRGQLLNIGFSHAKTDTIIFTDVDLRLTSSIDFVAVSKKFNAPYYPYFTVKHCEITSAGQYRLLPRKPWENCNGGMYVYTKEQFIAVNGHSNLYIGHSYEDTDLRLRANPKREPNTILHIKHPTNEHGVDVARNRYVFEHRHEIDIQEDGVKQTVCNDIQIESVSPLITKMSVKNITVCENFKYKHYLKEKF
jgi:hypothetical protein